MSAIEMLVMNKADVRRTIKSANFIGRHKSFTCHEKSGDFVVGRFRIEQYRTCSILSADFLGQFYQMRTVIGQSVCLRTRSSRWSPNGQTTLLCV